MNSRHFAFSLLAAALCAVSSAQAAVEFTLQNATSKPLQFSLMVPRTKIMSPLSEGNVATHSQNHFSSKALLPRCKNSWQCKTLKVVIQNWGKDVVFVECPKMYNPSGYNHTRHYKIAGRDSSALFCRLISKAAAKRYAQKNNPYHSDSM